MPRFFFNIRDGDQTLCDPEGTELAALDIARQEALIDARWILAEELRTGRIALDRRFEITDKAGQVLATVCFQDALSQPLDGTVTVPSSGYSCSSDADAAKG
jgi:hypothetical protein